jgi:hypothetical protein
LLSPDWNVFKANNKEYDETLYPVDHDRAGQIRDFSLFNHFVKPMAAGVMVTCVMDCCHSGSVLDLPYTFQPTGTGTIRMRQSMGSLSNLAFLYILAGGLLPGGFEDVTSNIEDVTGGNLEDYQGTGLEEMTNDTEAADFTPDDVDTGDFAGADAGDYDDASDFADAGDFGQPDNVVAGDDVSPDFADTGNYADAGNFDQSDVVAGEDAYPSHFEDRGVGDGGFDGVDGDDVVVGEDANPFDFGDRDFGDGGFGDGDFDGVDGGDVDCGCLGDILGNLFEEE